MQYTIAKQPYSFMGDASIEATHHRIQYGGKFNGTHSRNLNRSTFALQQRNLHLFAYHKFVIYVCHLILFVC